MDIRELRKLVEESQSVVVVENGRPLFVIMGYGAYQNLVSQSEAGSIDIPMTREDQGLKPLFGNEPAAKSQSRESELLERLNREILALKNQIASEETALPEEGESSPAQ